MRDLRTVCIGMTKFTSICGQYNKRNPTLYLFMKIKLRKKKLYFALKIIVKNV